jgi:putative DNA primase/helicase
LIGELSELTGIDHVRRKKEIAKHLDITTKELEKIVSEKDTTTQPEHWACEPWPEPVLIGPLLEQLSKVYAERVVLPPHGPNTMALWCIHAWTHEAAYASAFLMFNSPTRGCGKTTAMEAMFWTVPRSVMTSNISPSAIFRYIDHQHPTLLFDEAETHAKREDVRGILDAGHTRIGASVIRNVGDNFEPRPFSTWGPKVIGLIGKMHGTICHRSIIIPMTRKRKAVKVIKMRSRDSDVFKACAGRPAVGPMITSPC